MLLVNLDVYKTSRNITKSEDDAQLGLLLEQVSAFVKEYTGRIFIDNWEKSKVEMFDGATNSSLFLTELPIRVIKDVSISYDGGLTFEAIKKFTQYFVNQAQGTIFSGRPSKPVAPGAIRGIENVKVTYTGGFKKTPADLERAVIDLISYYYDEEYVLSKQFKDMSIQNLNVGSSAKLPPHIKRTLDLYRLI